MKDQRLDMQVWTANGENAICQLIIEPSLSEPTDEATRVFIFKYLLDGALEGAEMKLENEMAIRFEDYYGREYRMRGKVGIGLARSYIIGSTTYFMLGISVNEKEGSAEITRFLDSFRLTKKPDPAPALGSVSVQSASLREFSEPGHGFKVLIPGEPKRESTSIQSILIFTMVSVGDGIVCVVSRQRNPMTFVSPSAIDNFYKTFMDSYTKSSGFEITGETTVVLDAHQGREYKLKKNEATGTARVFLIGQDAYSVSAIAILPGVSNESILKILNSFKLIEKSPKDEFAEPPPPPPVPPKPETSDKRIKVSGGVLKTLASKKVEPEYPSSAAAAGVQGEVSVSITISETGKVIEAEVIKGHSLLRDAALQAARQWLFKPTELSGVPVKVIGVLTFNFTLK
ncbi:MAG: energy transducer TonB [Acidobacteria bacterium]|nr:energy transducer TonB [Acidobacteriota bacterium]